MWSELWSKALLYEPKHRQFLRDIRYLIKPNAEKMVPGGGIEPPTRGFSIHCSTPELPGTGERARRSGLGFLGEGHATVQWVFATFQWGFPAPASCASSSASATSSASSNRLEGMA